MDFQQREIQDGIRFSWNFWPNTKIGATRVVLPVGALYTPLKEIEGMTPVEYSPVLCSSCKSALNPYCIIDYKFKTWNCSICQTKNQFPQAYANNISEQTLPYELMQEYTTIEYVLPATHQNPNTRPIFMLVVDTAITSDEMTELKDSLQQSINFIPEDAMIGFITYGKMVQVHELGFQECPKAYVFRGDKEMSSKTVQTQLGVANPNDPLNKGDATQLKRFLVPVSECEFALNAILDDLQNDPWPVEALQRPARCLGAALNVAIGLLEAAGGASRGSRIVTLMGGAVTYGPGRIVSQSTKEMIRSHLDIQHEKDNTKYLKSAIKFYQGLADRSQKAGIVIDVFVAAVDQVGILEMKPCFEQTGGFYVMTDSFGNPVFKESFKKFFEVDDTGELKMGFLAKLTVNCSKEVKVSGAIGQVTSLKQKNQFVSDSDIGIGGTNQWYLGGLDRSKSIALYFDVANTGNLPQHHKIHLQFMTQYQHVNGTQRLRVTTCQRLMTNPDDLKEMAYGFDQETAAVLLARYSIYKTMTEESMDVIRWLDRMLIKLVARFAEFKKDDPNSFKLSREFSLFPQFMFYLRRSPFLQTFNASPDESQYYVSLIMRENVCNSLVMIQPALMSYDLESESAKPVLLDIDSMKPNVILLLDTFFYVCIWKGDTIDKWEQAGYHNDDNFGNFKGLLESPIEDAKFIMQERFPMPRFFITKPNDTNERKIKVKVNPSSQSSQANNQMVADGIFHSEDVSLNLFMQHLIRMAVQS